MPAAADPQESSPTVLVGQVDSLGIPEWRAWAAFYGSLDFYQRRSAVDVDRLLTTRVGLRSSDTSSLLATGAAFVTTIRQIESYREFRRAS